MNVQEDETPGDQQDHERDVLAERRARRSEPIGDPILIRRAETAEATAHELEDRLAGIQFRLREAEQQSQSASQRLLEREHELRRASERLSDGEQQLQAISTRLADRERELHTVSQSLSERERDLQAVSERLAEREQQLQRAELEIRGRVEALEQRVGEVQADLARERDARHAAERELQALRTAQEAVRPLIGELREIAQRLRVEAEAHDQQGDRDDQPQSASPVPADESSAETSGVPAGGGAEEQSNAQMAEALAAAVQRLRARVSAVSEIEEPPGEQQPGERQPYTPPAAVERATSRAWLAPAIRRVAQRRDPRLAAELVLELLPAQALTIEKPARYLARIAELGSYEISLANGRGSVRNLMGASLADEQAFELEGPAVAFAELAGGGRKLSAWRPPAGLRVRGGRRRARQLLASRAHPLALSELERAEVTVWPGLLLLALAEAIDPTSTSGHAFTVAFVIDGQQSAVLHVQALHGRPLAITRSDTRAEGEATSEADVAAKVTLSERGFARLITAQDLGDEKVLLEGEQRTLETLLSWTDRVQGIRRFGA